MDERRCRAISRVPGRSDASTGVPTAHASRTAHGRPSHADGRIIRSALASEGMASSTSPTRVTRSATPAAARRVALLSVVADLLSDEPQSNRRALRSDTPKYLNQPQLVLERLHRRHIDDRRLSDAASTARLNLSERMLL